MRRALSFAAVGALLALPVAGQAQVFLGLTDAQIQNVIDSDVCGDADILRAVYNNERGVIEVTCEEDVAAIFPLSGGFGAGAAVGVVALLAGAMGGGSSTNGTLPPP